MAATSTPMPDESRNVTSVRSIRMAAGRSRSTTARIASVTSPALVKSSSPRSATPSVPSGSMVTDNACMRFLSAVGRPPAVIVPKPAPGGQRPAGADTGAGERHPGQQSGTYTSSRGAHSQTANRRIEPIKPGITYHSVEGVPVLTLTYALTRLGLIMLADPDDPLEVWGSFNPT